MLKPPDIPMYDYLYGILSEVREVRAAIQLKAQEELPDHYLVFYLVSGAPEGHFSGAYRRENERYSVAVYDREKDNLESVEALLKRTMKEAGFLYIAKSQDLYYKETGHWSRTFDFRYYEEVGKNA